MSHLAKAYDPKLVEEKWYSFWEENGLFESHPNSGKNPIASSFPPQCDGRSPYGPRLRRHACKIFSSAGSGCLDLRLCGSPEPTTRASPRNGGRETSLCQNGQADAKTLPVKSFYTRLGMERKKRRANHSSNQKTGLFLRLVAPSFYNG